MKRGSGRIHVDTKIMLTISQGEEDPPTSEEKRVRKGISG